MSNALFIGRWQPLHKGHQWLFEQKLKEGIPIVVAIRDIPPDKHNPLTSEQTKELIEKAYVGKPVQVIIIPDIESVNYGRGVGYKVIEHVPPANIHNISATEIRKRIKENDDTWKEFIDESIQDLVRDFLNSGQLD